MNNFGKSEKKTLGPVVRRIAIFLNFLKFFIHYLNKLKFRFINYEFDISVVL